jgi:acyl-coenzyme A thioesterase PaaI-like protein
MATQPDSNVERHRKLAGSPSPRSVTTDGAIVDAQGAPETSSVRMPPDHFLAQLAVTFTYDNEGARGSTEIRSTLFAPGTTTLRTGLLVAMQDLLSGYMSGEPAGPTIDLRLQILRRQPISGRAEVVVRPLRVGGRIIVGEAMFTDSNGVSFAYGVSTFMRLPAGGTLDHSTNVAMTESSFDDLLGIVVRDPFTVEFTPGPRHRNNNEAAAIHGGIQALLAEVCAEHALGDGRRMTATDLDIRYLNSLRSPPLVARAHILTTNADGGVCSVALIDGADPQRVVSYLTLTMRYTD